jgi:hypothetical protein
MTLIRRNEASAVISDQATGIIELPAAPGPPLLLLTSDAASLTARRLHTFADADAAADFVRFWFPPDSRSGVTALWALPAATTDVTTEAIVLIRHPSDPELVYPFSFPAMEQALDMVRSEMRRGLRIGSVAIYYAARVTFDTAPDGDLLGTPFSPPQLERPALTARECTLRPTESRDWPNEGILSRAFHAMRFRRWSAHAPPFAGFGSPPGRF